jgi:hypothetical protein
VQGTLSAARLTVPASTVVSTRTLGHTETAPWQLEASRIPSPPPGRPHGQWCSNQAQAGHTSQIDRPLKPSTPPYAALTSIGVRGTSRWYSSAMENQERARVQQPVVRPLIGSAAEHLPSKRRGDRPKKSILGFVDPPRFRYRPRAAAFAGPLGPSPLALVLAASQPCPRRCKPRCGPLVSKIGFRC